jgi:hypothetical protein
MVDTLVPPIADPVLNDKGDHNAGWVEFHQQVADQLVKVHQGVTDGTDATAGDVGEYRQNIGADTTLASNTITTVASLALAAGDWDVSGRVQFVAGSGTHLLFGVGLDSIDTQTQATFPSGGITQMLCTFAKRISQPTTTTCNLVALAIFTGTMVATGQMHARRIR